MTKLCGLLRKRLAREDGYTLMELLVVIAIFGTITGALTSLFISATNAELDSNRRFQSQQSARLAFDQLRRDVHCATSATVAPGGASVALTLPAQCPSQPTVTWCAATLNGRTQLFRNVANPSVCDATSRRYADYLTTTAVFTYTAQSTSSLAKLKAVIKVNVNPSKVTDAYNLQDEIVLRNSQRS